MGLDARALEAGGALSLDRARPRRRWMLGWRRLGRHWWRLLWFAAWGAMAAVAMFYVMFFVYGAALCQGAREAMGVR